MASLTKAQKRIAASFAVVALNIGAGNFTTAHHNNQAAMALLDRIRDHTVRCRGLRIHFALRGLIDAGLRQRERDAAALLMVQA